ncbi:MAG: L,D-transpeptidase family protein [Proteobacteria bacterium]|nr:L,D-transpeptidase family protein [Pseudomonadota bacterium]
MAIVTLSDQRIEIFGPNGSLARSRVSSGQPGHVTPTGVFSVLERHRYHESNIYSGAPMPYMQRLTWSGIALHEGVVPGYPASHGCIRLPSAFAHQLWGWGKIGMRVVVTPTPTAPRSFAHAKLPDPVMRPAPGAPVVASVGLTTVVNAEAAPAHPMSPYEAAQDRLQRAGAGKVAAEKAVKPALELALRKSAEAQQAAAALRASAGILSDAEEHRELESLAMSTVQTEASEAIVLERLKIAEAGVVAAREAHEKLKAAEQEISDESFAAARAAREAQKAAEAASEELSLAKKAVSPISVFVSRKTGLVYVRQGFDELGEMPVTIAEPDRPLGTHVFTAMAEADGGSRMTWAEITVPTSGGETGRRGRGAVQVAERPASHAAEALDRITFPDEVQKLMAERLWPGASIIVSDYGLGETGQYTDFVILTR